MKTLHGLMLILALGFATTLSAQVELIEVMLQEVEATTMGSTNEEQAVGNATSDLNLAPDQKARVIATVRGSRKKVQQLNHQIAQTKAAIDKAPNDKVRTLQTRKLQRLMAQKHNLLATEQRMLEKHLTPAQINQIREKYRKSGRIHPKTDPVPQKSRADG